MKLLIVDDHAVVRAGLRRLFASLPNTAIDEVSSGEDAIARFREMRPDIVLLDINLPGIGGLELLKRILADEPAAKVLVFSMHVEPVYASRALQAGARGYVSKNAAPDELLTALQKVAAGGRYVEQDIAQELAIQAVPQGHVLDQLTERDMEILRLLGDGRSLSEIAQTLGIGYKTAANGCSLLKSKLGVARTADLIRLSVEMGAS